MSTSVSTAFVMSYERDVHEAYQRRGSKLLNSVRRATNVVGESHTFQKLRKGKATTKARNGTITPMNVEHETAKATLVDSYAGDWIDKLDEDKITIDEKRVLANAGAFALGRKVDDDIIGQLDGGGNETALAADLDLDGVLAAMKKLGDRDVFEDGRMFAIVPWTEWTKLLKIEQFASCDFIDRERLPFPSAAGEAKFWLGTIWMPHSGLETLTSGSNGYGFWYHEDAVGHASGREVTADITWHGDRAAHFVNHYMSQGAILIDETGVEKIETTRS